MKASDVMALIKEKHVQAVDVRFVDLPGLWQHFTVSAREFSADAFEEAAPHQTAAGIDQGPVLRHLTAGEFIGSGNARFHSEY